MAKRKRYYIYTWDMDKQEFTPQKGIRCGPYSSLLKMRRHIRELRKQWSDHSILVTSKN